jgi:hypothetical protein
MVNQPGQNIDSAKREQPLPPLEPGREVGWIFNDGEAVAIDRKESESIGQEAD